MSRPTPANDFPIALQLIKLNLQEEETASPKVSITQSFNCYSTTVEPGCQALAGCEEPTCLLSKAFYKGTNENYL